MRHPFTFFSSSLSRMMALLLLLLPLVGWGQTNPAPFDLSTGSFTFTGFAAGTTTTYPTSLQGHALAVNEPLSTVAAPYVTPAAADQALLASTDANNVAIRNEVASGISFINTGGVKVGEVMLALNTTGQTAVTVAWTARSFVAGARTYGIQLQYRVGSTGNFIYVPSSSYTSNGSAAAANFSVVLPVAAEGQAVVQLRWLFTNASAATGTRPRLGIDDITVSSTAGAPSPSFTPSPGSLTLFTYVAGSGPSPSQSFTLGGSNLTAGTAVDVTAPASYEVSLTSGSGYANALNFTNTAGGTLNTTIYVRLKTSLGVNTYNESVAVTGGGATAASVSVSGSVTAAPALTVTPGAFTTDFTTSQGAASAAQTYLLTGTTLSAAVTVTAPGGYEVAQGTPTVPGTYAATQSVTQANATAGRTIYVRLSAGTTAGTYGTSGSPLSVTNATTGATTQNVTVFGTVSAPVPMLSTTPTSLTGFATYVGTASTSQSYTLAGTNLPTAGTIQVTLPASSGYEISSDNSTFGQTASIAYTGTALPTTPAASVPRIYVRLTAAATAGAYNGVVVTNTIFDNTNTATSTTATIPVSGDVNALPTISTTAVNPTPALPGSSVTVTYTTTGAFAGGNTFTAELSTATGTFPGTVLTTTGSSAGSLTVTIPAAAAAGTAYTIRVNGSSPAVTGSASPAFAITGGIFEPFELVSTPGNSYVTPATSFTFQSGNWTLFQALTGSTGSEAYNGDQSIRIRGGGYAQYTKANGVGTVSLSAARYTGDANVSFTLQYSTDGTNFTTVPGTVPAAGNALPVVGSTHSFTGGPYSYAINVTGPVVIRIGNTNTTVGSSNRINIDDVSITDYTSVAPLLTAAPTTLTLSATTGQTTETTYTLTGQNLSPGTTASISSPDPSILVSVDGGTTYTATATSAAATAGGSLSQVVNVQFTAPGTGGTTNATIANTIASFSLSAPVTVDATAIPVVTYTWTGGTSTSWSDASNWSPTRTSPAANDILVFNGTTTPTPTVDTDFTSPQTIGQLQLINGISATFSNTGDRVLNISNLVTGPDLTQASGTTLTITNPSSSTTATGLTLQLASGATALVAGTMVFDAATAATNGTGAHRLLGTSAGNIEFVTGSLFRTGANAAGNPFGTATATNGAVTFRNGSRYEQLGGQNPFSLAQPTSIAIFEPSSYYYYGVTGTTPPSLSGRTYGILEYNVGNGNGNTSGVANPVTVVGDLIITSGDVHLDLNGGVILKGNVLVNGSSSLSFNPSSTATVQLNGTTPQTIGGTAPAGAITIGTNSTLQVNNAAGVVLARSLALRRLTLTSGTVTTTATNLLTLSSTAILNGGSATSFVNGPLARDTPAGLSTPTSYVFPIGKASFYRPFTLNLSSQIDASTYTAEQIEGDPNPAGAANLLPINGFGSAPLKRVSKFRGFLLASTNATNNNAIGTLTLSFGIGDGVNNPGDAGLVVGVSSGGSGFGNLDRSASTGTGTGPGGTDVVGTLTSTIIPTATASALFVLAATNENNTIGQAINPLPVELTSISAQRQADKAVAVKWATATEKSSNYFQVQRSLDGREFATVATVTARGTSSQATAYTSLDKTAPMATLYYRLRQVDLDGTAAYSPVVTVAGTERTTLHLYPNPATEVLHVDAPAATSYRVLNLLGQLVLTGTTAEGATLNVRTLPAGAYLLELHTAQGRQVSKFTKE